MTPDPADGATSARVVEDAFGRVRELVEAVTADASPAVLAHRPTESSNSIAWLVWHLTRVQDTHLAHLANLPAVWESEGWADRFALSLPPSDTGYGATPADVAALDGVTAEQLDGYHRAVHDLTLTYVRSLDDAALDEVIDRAWDPPVTASARIVSVLSDCLQHLGQAAYLRGMQE